MRLFAFSSLAVIFAVTALAQQAPTIGGCPLFPADNVWNTRVDSLPLDAHSSDYITNISSSGTLRYDITIPINIVPGTTPLVPIIINYPDESDPGPYPFPPTAQVEQGSDLHVILVDKDHCMLYETFNSYLNPDGSWTVDSAAKWSLLSDALRPAGWTSSDAAGLPVLPGLLRYDEVAAGQVNHALRFTAPYTQRLYIWPARHYASSNTSPTLPPMGQRFRLKAGFDISGYSPHIQTILKAMKTYGIILADNGLAWEMQFAVDSRWNTTELDALRGIAGSNLEAVDESSLIMNVDSGQAASSAAPTVTITPASATLGPSQTQQFTATVTGSTLGVAWSMNPPVGTISATGLYTAPSTISSAQSVTVTATLSGGAVSGSAVVNLQTVTLPAVASVSVSPSSIVGGNTVSVTVTLTGVAPATGAAVSVTGSNPAFPPANVTIPAGQVFQTFTLPTAAVSTTTAVSITASYNSTSAVSSVLTVAPPPPASFTPIFINAGGGSYTDPQGQAWSADNGYIAGLPYSTGSPIQNTTTPALYQSCRYGTFQYQFPVPNGNYTVTLKFAEPYWSSPGSRVFNVGINGAAVLSNFDIVAQAGAGFTALDRSFPISVTGGLITIQFTSVTNFAVVNAIQITTPTAPPPPPPPASSSSILVNAGGAAYTDPQGQAWSADTGFTGGATYATGAAIQNTTAPALYQSVRYGPSFQYQFTVPSGSYTVTLKFAEPYFSTAGSRVFNVSINGAPVLSNFDVVAQAGAGFTALDKSFPVTVTNGQITIQFTSVMNYAIVNAIQVAQSSTPPPPAFTPIQVNTGGGSYTDPQGQVWSADTGFDTGAIYATGAAIQNTTTPALYQSVRYGPSFKYQFTVPNASYTVTLKFAEPYFSTSGSRVFNAAINGATVLSNFDVAAQAGAGFTALDRSFPVTVSNGQITIQFTGVVNYAIINAIRITNP